MTRSGTMPSTEFSVLLKHDYERLMTVLYAIEAW